MALWGLLFCLVFSLLGFLLLPYVGYMCLYEGICYCCAENDLNF